MMNQDIFPGDLVLLIDPYYGEKVGIVITRLPRYYIQFDPFDYAGKSYDYISKLYLIKIDNGHELRYYEKQLQKL